VLFSVLAQAMEVPIIAYPGVILFECTTTAGSRALKKYTALRADVAGDGNVIVGIGGKKYGIPIESLHRTFHGSRIERFEMRLKDSELQIEVSGRPLNRNGFARLNKLGGKAAVESPITCH
jgi:hypothetical protein